MKTIITDTLRVNNARSFIDKIRDPNRSYYTFIGLPNATEVVSNWDTSPPSPRDCLDDSNGYWDTMVALKKVLQMMFVLLLKSLNGHLRQSAVYQS